MLGLTSPTQGHSSILMQLERFDLIFNMWFNAMRPAFTTEHKYGVTMLLERRRPENLGLLL